MKKQCSYSKTSRSFALVLMLLCVLSFTNICAIAASTGSLGVSPSGVQWVVTNDTEIFWLETADSDKSNTELADQVKLFASELEAKGCTSSVLPIKYGDDISNAGTNDIVLNLSSSHNITTQGFIVEVPVGGKIVVKASDADGLFYGCRYVIQQLILGTKLIVGQTYTDSPDTLERGLFLDCARKYFTPDWIKDMIREISWSNMNTLYLHFSEEMGLGIKLDESDFSEGYKWIANVAGRDGTMCVGAVIADDDRYLTKSDIIAIAEVAKLYHVEIVPSFDSPGHMNYLVHEYNKQYGYASASDYNKDNGTFGIGNYFKYNNYTTLVKGSRNTSYSRGINIASEEARNFAYELYTAYGNFFRSIGCTKFDLGGDELLGWGSAVPSSSVTKWKQLDHWKEYAKSVTGKTNVVAYDGFIYYLNSVYSLLVDLGYNDIRMWNDDALRSSDTGWQQAVTLNSNIRINYWTSGQNTIDTYAKSYKIINFLDDYNYYIVNTGTNGAKVSAQTIYDSWTPYTQDTSGTSVSSSYRSNVLGGAYAIWCDHPSLHTEAQVKSGAIDPIRANAAKCWNTSANSYETYSAFASRMTTLGSAPSNLKEATITFGVDTAALVAAIEVYDNNYETNRFAYTTESFGNYTAAVEAGRALLNGEPSQSDVNKAVDAINAAIDALENKPEYDASYLKSALAEYKACNSSAYTAESYNAYKQLAVEAEAYISSDADIEQTRVDSYYSRLFRLSEELVLTSNVSENDYVFSVASRTSTANLGKYFIFAVGINKGYEFSEIRIYDDLNNRVYIEDMLFFNTNDSRDMYQIKFQAQHLGTRTYTIYILDKDGITRSADSLSCTVNVW